MNLKNIIHLGLFISIFILISIFGCKNGILGSNTGLWIDNRVDDEVEVSLLDVTDPNNNGIIGPEDAIVETSVPAKTKQKVYNGNKKCMIFVFSHYSFSYVYTSPSGGEYPNGRTIIIE